MWREIGDFSVSKENLFVVYSDGETLADTRLKNSQFRGREKGGDGGGTLETLSIPCPGGGENGNRATPPRRSPLRCSLAPFVFQPRSCPSTILTPTWRFQLFLPFFRFALRLFSFPLFLSSSRSFESSKDREFFLLLLLLFASLSDLNLRI